MKPLALLAGCLSGVALAASLPTATVAWKQVPLTLPTEGVVEAVRQTTVAAQVSGRIVSLAVKAGDTVEAGTVLARLDDRELGQAVAAGSAQVAAAEANLANAQAQLRRTEALVAQRFVSQAALDAVQSQYRAAAAQVTALKAGTGQAAVSRGHAVLTAPYRAVVARVDAEVGDLAVPGRPLLTLFGPGDLRVVAHLPQSDVSRLPRGGSAQVEVAPGRWLASRALTVLPTADPVSHAGEVRLDLPADSGLVPGQYARTLFTVGTARRLVVPAGAVLRRSELTAVYVRTADGRFLQRQVRLGDSFGAAGVEVLAGVTTGEAVALDPVKAGLAR